MKQNTPSVVIVATLAGCMAVAACDDGKSTSTPEQSQASAKPTTDASQTKKEPGPTKPAAVKLAPGLSKGEVIVGSCETEGVDSECADAVAKEGDDASRELATKQLATLCKMGKGTTSDAPCKNANVVGRCRSKLEFGKDRGDRAFQYVAHYLSSGKTPYDAASAEKHCTNKRKGTWHAP